MVIQQKANSGLRRIALVQLAQQGDEVRAGMVVADDLGDAAGVEIKACQQRYRSQSLVLIVPKMAPELPWLRRQIRRCCRQRLNAGLLVLLRSNQIRGEMNAVASGQFLNQLTGQVLDATAVSNNEGTGALRLALKQAGEIYVRLRDVIPDDETAVHHAEQLLLEWAKKNNYLIYSIAPAGQPMCPLCATALKSASEAQESVYGFGFAFY